MDEHRTYDQWLSDVSEHAAAALRAKWVEDWDGRRAHIQACTDLLDEGAVFGWHAPCLNVTGRARRNGGAQPPTHADAPHHAAG